MIKDKTQYYKDYWLKNKGKIGPKQAFYHASDAGELVDDKKDIKKRLKRFHGEEWENYYVEFVPIFPVEGKTEPGKSLMERFDGKCACCGCECDPDAFEYIKNKNGNRQKKIFNKYPTKDHINPIRANGKESVENTQLLCWGCNKIKH